MKHNIFFLILIGMASLSYISCEKTGYQINENEISGDIRISNREVEECEDCPNVDDCCCAVELQVPNSSANLRLCGTSDGASACSGSATGSCPAFTGGGQVINLSSSDSRALFCMGLGNPFYIENLSMLSSANIYLTCQHDLTSPQILTITIPAGERWYYSTNSSCILSKCTD